MGAIDHSLRAMRRVRHITTGPQTADDSYTDDVSEVLPSLGIDDPPCSPAGRSLTSASRSASRCSC
jgi:hypothetical protein